MEPLRQRQQADQTEPGGPSAYDSHSSSAATTGSGKSQKTPSCFLGVHQRENVSKVVSGLGRFLSPPMNPPGPQLLCPGNDMKVMPLQQGPCALSHLLARTPREADTRPARSTQPPCQCTRVQRGERTLINSHGKRTGPPSPVGDLYP
ncbi:hypothetical protein MG293_016354 [Ovis ammon polii]|uniref:Uncharacterized protein n=1 Tax=Ovis ammon polii TaxID=230172 RepID=A0AAD4Y0P3_OVIAM|nr:hypothetical protein MG293_016354 [Ovis ammon polii]